MRILLGVSGGIAAYKVPAVVRTLREAGHTVRVIPTQAALDFVGAPTWEALSAEPVSTSVFDGADTVDHVRLGREAELMIVAPATADLLARASAGMANDLLTATLLTVTCPVVLAPAMHTEMWQHPATQANVATLRDRGIQILDPAVGRLTGSDSGPGRLPEPEDIVAAALALTSQSHSATELDLHGLRVVISAGGTREYLDPVRFLGNRSSGRQGVELAREAAARGAIVELVTAHVDPALLPDVTCTAVDTTADLHSVMIDRAAAADVLVMAAAVADFRPAQVSAAKMKKIDSEAVTPIELIENPDILAGLVRDRRDGQIVVGFAAETGDDAGSVLEHGRTKAQRKGADLLAVNAVGEHRGFGDVDNFVHVLDARGMTVTVGSGSKAEVAAMLWDAVVNILNGRNTADARAVRAESSDRLQA